MAYRPRPTITSVIEHDGELLQNAQSRLRTIERALQQKPNDANIRRQQQFCFNRINAIIEHQDEFELIASHADQKEHYGLEKWETDWVTLNELDTLDGCDLRGEELRAMIWKKVPSSKFKQFQELFCNPEDYIVPRFRYVAGFVHWIDVIHNGFDNLTLDGCLVSPDRMTDEFAEGLELVTFNEKDERKPKQRLLKKGDPEVILALKKLWESLRPLQKGNRRMWVVSPPLKHHEERYTKGDFGPDATGSVLFVQNAGDGEMNGHGSKKKIVSRFPNAYKAARKPTHQRTNHNEEQTTLTEVNGNLHSSVHVLDKGYRKDTPAPVKGELISKFQTTVRNSLDALGDSVNPDKVEAEQFLAAAQPMKDKSGKTNTTFGLAKTTAARGRLDDRTEEIIGMEKMNEQDRLVLKKTIEAQEVALLNVRKRIRDYAPRLEAKSGLFDELLTQQEAETLSKLLTFSADLEGVRLQPLVKFAHALQQQSVLLHDALKVCDRVEAQAALLRMQIMGKLQGIRRCIEWVNTEIIDPKKADLEGVDAKLESMFSFLTEHQIFPELTIPEYDAPYRELRIKMMTMRLLVGHCLHPEHGQSKVDLVGTLKKFNDEIDVEAVLDALNIHAPSAPRTEAE